MAYIWWGWTQAQDDRGFEELEVAFTVHNDVGDMSGLDGLYLMVCYGKIAETPFYLGIQTNAHSATRPLYGRGKAAIFSRWETRDLELARFSEEDGWTQSSGHEGDFIGVRRSYDWGPGEYIARLGPDGEDRDGVWFGLWITDQRTGTETWIGSMKFPKVKGAARIGGPVYSTMEVYGGTPIRPIDIPEWHVTMSRPSGDGRPARRGATGYSMFGAEILNSNIRYVRRKEQVNLGRLRVCRCLTYRMGRLCDDCAGGVGQQVPFSHRPNVEHAGDPAKTGLNEAVKRRVAPRWQQVHVDDCVAYGRPACGTINDLQ